MEVVTSGFFLFVSIINKFYLICIQIYIHLLKTKHNQKKILLYIYLILIILRYYKKLYKTKGKDNILT